MRIVVGILLLGISVMPAAAQSYGGAAPAPAATSAAPPAAPAPAASAAPAPAATTAAAPAAPGPIYPPGSADFYVNGSTVMAAAPSRSPEQQKADEASQAAWQARCHPTVVEDREGVRRTRYAAGDCDLSPFNTAGGK